MSPHVKKTNAARLLDELDIPYQLCSAPVNEADLSAVSMACSLGVPPGEVYKTLVARGDRHGVLLACIPAEAELDLKLLAQASGNKSVAMVPLKDVFPLTGYIRGGCSPLGTRKAYPVYLDESAMLYERIFVSAGQRGVQLHLSPEALLVATGGRYAAISRRQADPLEPVRQD